MRVDFTFQGRQYYARATTRSTMIVSDMGEDVTNTNLALTLAARAAVKAELARLYPGEAR